jgi:ADP-heptose:LPS heptosyltransferase
LVIRRDNIGDLVCTTPLLDALRVHLPRAHIGVLVNSYNAQVLERNPAVDELFVYEKFKHRSAALLRFARDRLRVAARLRRAHFDVAIVPAPSPRALRFARLISPSRIIAAATPAPEGCHEVERVFELSRELGVTGAPGPMRVVPDREHCVRLKSRLGAGTFVAIHISARRPAQRWPLERYAALAHELARGGGRVLLLWAPGARDNPRHPGDDAAAEKVVSQAQSASVVPVPTPDLTTLIAALSIADRVVCPDGGAMHLAAALGKPVVALFGDSPVERWRPWGVPHRVVQPPSHNLADLPLEPVLEAHRELR